jgi:hypothetical protein
VNSILPVKEAAIMADNTSSTGGEPVNLLALGE